MSLSTAATGVHSSAPTLTLAGRCGPHRTCLSERSGVNGAIPTMQAGLFHFASTTPRSHAAWTSWSSLAGHSLETGPKLSRELQMIEELRQPAPNGNGRGQRDVGAFDGVAGHTSLHEIERADDPARREVDGARVCGSPYGSSSPAMRAHGASDRRGARPFRRVGPPPRSAAGSLHLRAVSWDDARAPRSDVTLARHPGRPAQARAARRVGVPHLLHEPDGRTSARLLPRCVASRARPFVDDENEAKIAMRLWVPG
jgi:hypothetical protein